MKKLALTLLLLSVSWASAGISIPGGGGAGATLPPVAGQAGKFLNTDGSITQWLNVAGGGDMLRANNLSDLTNVATARTNLSLVPGTNVQAFDADLTIWAGITPSANTQTFLGAANYAAMRTQLGLVVGTDVQAWDADLDSLSAASGTNTLYYRSATNTWSAVNIGANLTFSAGTLSATAGGGGTTWGAITGSLSSQTDLNTALNTKLTSNGDGSNLTGLSGTQLATGSVGPTQLASTAVSAGSYTNSNITIDADGRVTAAANGSTAGGVIWGTITGSLSNQSDLQAELNAKQSLDPDLTSLSGATGTNTIYYRSASNTWSPVTIGTNLSFVTGTLDVSSAAYQPLDSDLTSIAALITTSFGRGLLDDADATAGRASLGVVIGANVQAWDADLDSLAATASTNTIYYRSAANTWSPVTIGTNLTFTGGTLASAGGSGANPTASVGLTAINGSAVTFMRSDGSPALDQSITPTWTGLHIFNAGVDIKNGATAAGLLRIYEDSDDGGNFASFSVPALAANTVYTLPPDDGDPGEFLRTNGAGVTTWESLTAAPGGADTQIQFNDGGALGGDADFTWNKVTNVLTIPSLSVTTLNSLAFEFEGATADAFETTLTVTDPTADRTVTLPDASTIVPVYGYLATYTGFTSAHTITLPDANFSVARIDAAQTFTGLQQFTPGATVAGINVGSIAGDPSAPSNGGLWYDSTANELTARINGVNVALGAGGGGQAADADLTALSALTGTNTIYYRSAADTWTAVTPGSGVTFSGGSLSITRTGVRRTVYINAGAMIPRTTNGAATGTTETTTNDIMVDSFDFDSATEEGVGFWWTPPTTYNAGTITVRFYWTCSSGTGNVKWDVAARAFADDDAIDQALGTEQSAGTDTLLATGDMHISPTTPALTIGGTPAANRPTYFQITRDTGTDTLSADAKLLGATIEFTESATEPSAQ